MKGVILYEKDTTLVVMTAGMGSCFDGLKQIEPIGPDGEVILDFSVYDAVKAGFNKVVFIIRKDIEKDFRNITKRKIEKIVDTECVFRDMDKLSNGFSVPDGIVPCKRLLSEARKVSLITIC